MKRHIILAVLAGIACGILNYYRLAINEPTSANDFGWVWYGARLLLAGQDPYSPNFYPSDAPLFYPAPALLVALPFALLPFRVASGLFVTTSVALLTYGFLRRSRPVLPLVLSAPFLLAVLEGQWSPLIVASAVLPFLQPIALVKPNVGLPILLTYGTRCGLIASMVVLISSLLILPGWPVHWMANLGTHSNFVPLLTFPGPILLAALFFWRSRNALLLLLMSLMPQRLYDALPLWLLPRSRREGLLLSLGSCVALLVQAEISGTPTRPTWIVVFLYVPAMLMVIRQQRTPAMSIPQAEVGAPTTSDRMVAKHTTEE